MINNFFTLPWHVASTLSGAVVSQWKIYVQFYALVWFCLRFTFTFHLTLKIEKIFRLIGLEYETYQCIRSHSREISFHTLQVRCCVVLRAPRDFSGFMMHCNCNLMSSSSSLLVRCCRRHFDIATCIAVKIFRLSIALSCARLPSVCGIFFCSFLWLWSRSGGNGRSLKLMFSFVDRCHRCELLRNCISLK